MNTINLQQTLPDAFSESDRIVSDVWHKDVMFRKEDICLIEATSGTGKSSLCSFVYGYRDDYQGIICFDDENIRKKTLTQWVEIRKHSLSMLFQDLRLFPELTAFENVQLKNSLTGFKPKKELLSLFARLGMEDKVNAKVSRLSFGQQQRIAFIRTLSQPFDFIFLDEPISHLDDENGKIMGEILMEEVKKQGAGILITSIGKHIELSYTKILKL